ncbi:aldo/keto reductase [Microbacterium ulmi]|uniref:Aldo/keto reductase n=1 Tax=Microbacterium ulmi TaxID=179095 RepID=A0A7Y2LZ42_9MICO|nr:aldo/keto reductase [Microbacterium ulmi]NII68444.1 putative oxidoreductase [Microbacterium ulmi]NNH03034.1 aldo/keto reductase [Microbacterium ulmi]
MKDIEIGRSGLRGSQIALGCMRIDSLADADLAALLTAARDEGITVFDHADIYADGRCEEAFGRALDAGVVRRDEIVLQSKAGIRPGRYDLSGAHLIAAVEASLRRLRTDRLDLFLLHRPDALVDPDEVAAAFDELHAAGKVLHFGVSNHSAGQIALLAGSVRQPLVADQLQLSVAHTPLIDAGLNVNMASAASLDHDGGTLDYCRLHGITIQPWSVLQHGYFAGSLVGSAEYPALNEELSAQAGRHGVTPAAIAVAWLLRHPAAMLPVVGTTRPARVRELARAADVELTREEWYSLYLAAGNSLP